MKGVFIMKTFKINNATRESRWFGSLALGRQGTLVGIARLIETLLGVFATMTFAKLICALGTDDLFKWIMIDIVIETVMGMVGAVSHNWTRTFGLKYQNSIDRKMMQEYYTAKLTGMNSGTITSYIEAVSQSKKDIVVNCIMLPSVFSPFLAVLYKMIKAHCGVIMMIPIAAIILSSVIGILCGQIRYSECSKRGAAIRGTKVDLFLNSKTLRFLGKEAYAAKKLDEVQDGYMPYSSKLCRNVGYQISYLIFLIPTLFGVMMIPKENRLELGTILLTSVSSFMGSVNFILDSVDRVATLNENLEHLECLKDKDTRVKESIKKGLHLRNFHFGYTKEDGTKTIFKAPKLDFNYGSRTVITGSSGLGKSTLANAIVGTVEASDFNPVKTFYVYQESELLDTSLRENINLGVEHSDEEIEELLEELGLGNWVHYELDNGLDTIMGERGSKVSSGQKQRINIVRTILKMRECDDDCLIILDEPTSNLDDATEKVAVNLLDKNCKNTLLVITHRPEIIRICEHHVIVNDDHVFEQLD